MKLFFLISLIFTGACVAQREPVLKQIDHPHNYYYREMYLPQVTSGPSSVTWSPDSHEVIYSMKGSLWRQALDSTTPVELTHGPGYDYQPDWSPDGRYVVYAKYHADAIELWLLDLQTKQTTQLTKGGAVNVEPRWSPDGARIAYVSTAYNKHFHIFQLRMVDGAPQNTERLTKETVTAAKRYYYSQVNHEISPTWSPDGKELIFIHNPDRIYGTGGLWRMTAEPETTPKLIHYEETTWRARPDWSRDGKRVVFASYDRRQWHQLWLTTPDGGDPIALTYGDYDNTNPRWSPDGKKIAFISNRSGNTELWFVEPLGGKQTRLDIKLPHRPTITIKAANTRVSVRGADGRFYGPDNAWFHADDSYVRPEMTDEPRYFHCASVCEVAVPEGEADVFIMRGFGYKTYSRKARAGETIVYPATPLPPLPGAGRWISADVHVHMNYGGNYRNTPERLLQQAKAEDLNIVFDLIVNKEQRIPDIAYFSPQPDKASTADYVISHGQEFHTSNWGHTGLLGLKDHYLLPDYSTYQNTAAASPYPTNAVVADLTHVQGGLLGYVHPYEIEDMPDPSVARNHSLPVDVALGKVDYLEVLGFSDHRMTASVWYRLLNLGFRIPAAGGTDAMANFASLRGPVGTNRAYVNLPAGPVNVDRWLAGLKAGRTFATNAPLLAFMLGQKDVGEELQLQNASEVLFSASLRSIVPIDHLEVVCNGKVIRDIQLAGDHTVADASGTIPIYTTGWCVLRAWNEKPTYPILDIYPYGTTSPIYINVRGATQQSPEDARYFLTWVDHIIARTEEMTDWNFDSERTAVLNDLRRARAAFAAKQ
jgi:Tol biopolymer transport system component